MKLFQSLFFVFLVTVLSFGAVAQGVAQTVPSGLTGLQAQATTSLNLNNAQSQFTTVVPPSLRSDVDLSQNAVLDASTPELKLNIPYVDEFNAYKNEFDDLDDDFSGFRREYRDAVRDDDTRDIRDAKDDLEELDEDLEDLYEDIEDLEEDVDDEDNLPRYYREYLEEGIEDLLDDIEELRDDIKVTLKNTEIQRAQERTNVPSFIPSKTSSKTENVAVSAQPAVELVRFDSFPTTTTTTVEESSSNLGMIAMTGGVVILLAAIIMMLALLFKQ